ncbi:FecR domain-containing protein [Akkermansiaceae bacterium]|nr:FecR domain-containing protein [Akkermansiaceae bacterium]
MNEELILFADKYKKGSLTPLDQDVLNIRLANDTSQFLLFCEALRGHGVMSSGVERDINCGQLDSDIVEAIERELAKLELEAKAKMPESQKPQPRIVAVLDEAPLPQRGLFTKTVKFSSPEDTQSLQEQYIHPFLRKKKKRSSAPILISAMAACLVIGMSIFLYHLSMKNQELANSVFVRIEQNNPQAQLIRDGQSQSLRLSSAIVIKSGDTVISGASESLKLVYTSDASSILLEPYSELVFNSDKQKKITLQKGEIFLDVARQPEHEPMLVNTQEAEVMVLGTKFNLKHTKGITSLGMEEGKVEIKSLVTKQIIAVTANQTAKVSADGSLSLQRKGKIIEEHNGMLLVEAEDFTYSDNNGNDHWWQYTDAKIPSREGVRDSDVNHAAAASGSAYMEILPDLGNYRKSQNYSSIPAGKGFLPTPVEGPYLAYKIRFNTKGRYYLWVRSFPTTLTDRSIYLNINDQQNTIFKMVGGEENQWNWFGIDPCKKIRKKVPRSFLTVPAVGEYTIKFYMREDGVELDQWILTRDPQYRPSL